MLWNNIFTTPDLWVSQELICPAMAMLSLGVRRWHCQDSITQDRANQSTTKPYCGVSRYEDLLALHRGRDFASV
jgi:hypothetical protein